MALVPVLLFGPAAKKPISRLLFCHGVLTRLRLRVPRKGICLLVAFVMLLGPEGFNSLAYAEVQYANLGTSSWEEADRTIHYYYDANGSLEKKIYLLHQSGQNQPPGYRFRRQKYFADIFFTASVIPFLIFDRILLKSHLRVLSCFKGWFGKR